MAIIAWNGGQEIEACLRTVLEQSLVPAQRLIVDNGSTDGSIQRLLALDPGLEVITNERNLGFARAANQAFSAARHDWLLLLNQDVLLSCTYLEDLLAAATSDGAVGSVTGKLLRTYTDQPVIDSTGHILYRNGLAANRGQLELDHGQYDTSDEVFGVCAAAALYRMSMLRETCVGVARPFDERFFSYIEDVDLDWRARWLGWRAFYVPAVAWHRRGGANAGWTSRQTRQTVANRLMLVGNNDLWPDGLSRVPAVLAVCVAGVLRSIVSAPESILGPIDALRVVHETRARRQFLSQRRRLPPREIRDWMRPYPFRQRMRELLRTGGARRPAALLRPADPPSA